MSRSILLLVILAAAAAPLPAQPQDGHLIVTMRYPTFAGRGGFTISLDPASGAFTTLGPDSIRITHEWIRMAPNNTDLVLGANDSEGLDGGVMLSVDPAGHQTVLTADGLLNIGGFELDHDDTWLIAGLAVRSSQYRMSALWGLEHGRGVLQTLFFHQGTGEFADVAIDRDPGAFPYVVAVYENTGSTLASPRLLGADRSGVLSTIVAGGAGPGDRLDQLQGVELDPASGDYLTCDSLDPILTMVDKSGGVSPVSTLKGLATSARFARDGTAWVAGATGYSSPQPTVFRIDRRGTIISLFFLRGLPFSQAFPTSVEIYGSRRLVCRGSGAPGSTIHLRIQSRRPGDGGKPYAMALSLGRRPGLRFPNGERLDLALDPLFFLTAANPHLPPLLERFQGVTDASGNAEAQVNLPSTLPRNLGIPVFAGGVILDASGVCTVTNTHWFVLN